MGTFPKFRSNGRCPGEKRIEVSVHDVDRQSGVAGVKMIAIDHMHRLHRNSLNIVVACVVIPTAAVCLSVGLERKVRVLKSTEVTPHT